MSKFQLASLVKSKFPGVSFKTLTDTYSYDKLKKAYEEILREREEEIERKKPKPYRLTIRVDFVIYDKAMKRRDDGKVWKYGDNYFPKNNNMARIAALYGANGDIRPGWERVLNSFPRRYQLTPPERWDNLDAWNLAQTVLYGVYRLREGVKNYPGTTSLEDALDNLIDTEIFPNQSDLQVMVRSYTYTKTEQVQAIAPQQMLLGHSELENEFGNKADAELCVPLAHCGHAQFPNMTEHIWTKIFGRYKSLYTVEELIERLYSKRDVSVVLYDSAGKIIYYKHTNQKHRMLVAEITSGHMYGDLPNGPIRNDIIARAQRAEDNIALQSKHSEAKCKKCNEEFYDRSLLTYHMLSMHDDRVKRQVDAEDLHKLIRDSTVFKSDKKLSGIIQTNEIYKEIIGDIITKFKIKPYVNRANDQITHVRISKYNIDIIKRRGDQQSEELAQAFGLKYQGETRTVLLKRMWETLIPNYRSTFSHITDGFFRQNKFPVDCRVRIGEPRLRPSDEQVIHIDYNVDQDAYEQIYQHDTKNAYLAALISNDIPVYTALDYPERFTPMKIDDISTGWYRVVGSHDEFLNETGWYCDTLVRTALLLKVIKLSDITAHYRPTYVIRKEVCREFLQRIIDTDEDAVKDVNKLIGYFRLCTSKNQTTNISNNEPELEYFNKSGAKVSPIIDTKLDYTGYSFIVAKREYEKHQITSAVYFYVIQTLYTFLMDMKYQLQAQGCNVIGYCTDAVYFQLPEGKNIEQHITPVNRNRNLQTDLLSIGDHYIGKFKPAIRSKLPGFSQITQRSFGDILQMDHPNPVVERFTCNISPDIVYGCIDDEESFLLSGLTGAGKTTLLKKILTHLEEQEKTYKVLAFSNCAVSLYESASTFHREFGICVESNSSARSLLKKCSEYDWIIIDEYSMIPDNIWGYLSLIAQHTRCRFILAGDHRQMPPIFSTADYMKIQNKPNIFDNPTVRKIHSNNVISCDYSNRVTNKEFLSYIADESVNFTLDRLSEFGVNIEYMRPYAKRIDKARMVQTDYSIVCYDKTREAINKVRARSTDVSECQPGHLLISVENKQSAGIIKNTHYVVHSRGEYCNYCENCQEYNTDEYNDGIRKSQCTKCTWFEGLRLDIDANIHDKNEFIIITSEDIKYFDYGYAFTIWRAQGCTIRAPITINDWFALSMEGKPFHEKFIDRDLQRRIIYTAISRVGDPREITIIN